MTKGWIAIDRKIFDHWLWSDKPFSRGQAWIDLLLMANHQNNKFLLGNELLEVERGSFITSELKLMDRWGWSKSKVRYFLNALESDSMLVKKSDRKKTTITIVNYSAYQDLQTTEEPQKNHRKTTKRPQKDTNNNDNNVNNDNNINSSRFTPPTLEEVKEYCFERKNKVDCEKFIDFYTSKNWMVGKNKMKDWKASVRTWEKSSNSTNTKPKSSNKFNNFQQRTYDYEELERQLLGLE